MLYRELDFPLKEIKDMLSKPDYDRQEALAAHKSLLLLKIERLRRLTGLVDSMMRGENTMSFQEFDMHEIEEDKRKSTRKEAKERVGVTTEAYRESEKKTSGYGEEKWRTLNEK